MKILEQPFWADYGQMHLEIIGEAGHPGEAQFEDIRRGFAWFPNWVDFFLANDFSVYTLSVWRVARLSVDRRAALVLRVPFYSTGAMLRIESLIRSELAEFDLEQGAYQLQFECTWHPEDLVRRYRNTSFGCRSCRVHAPSSRSSGVIPYSMKQSFGL